MSYTRRYSATLRIPVSGSVSYPASEHGGTVSYSDTAVEDVEIEIYVDTDPYDSAVSGCNTQVGLLTGAVAATEIAQVASIKANSKKVGDTIVQGFFKTVSSEITQQIAELKSQIDSTLTHLQELRQRILQHKEQMGVDYQRLLDRYTKVFNDLDRELSSGIRKLEAPLFNFRETTDDNLHRLLGTDMVNTVTLGAAEEANLHTTMAVANMRQRAKEALMTIRQFLAGQRRNDRMLKTCKIDGYEGEMQYCPVMYVETVSPGPVGRAMFAPNEFIGDKERRDLEEKARNTRFNALSDENKQKVSQYIDDSIRQDMSGTDEHSRRVRECMRGLINLQAINRS